VNTLSPADWLLMATGRFASSCDTWRGHTVDAIIQRGLSKPWRTEPATEAQRQRLWFPRKSRPGGSRTSLRRVPQRRQRLRLRLKR
jgi:hypothetical protein